MGGNDCMSLEGAFSSTRSWAYVEDNRRPCRGLPTGPFHLWFSAPSDVERIT
jgi:hypothetical protein